MAKIALGTWAWGAGAFGGDTVFGSKTDVENLKPVFDTAMKAGLSLWDTATAYGMGESERILGQLAGAYSRADVQISTKFTPQIAEVFENSVEKMADASIVRMGCDYIDVYWIHNEHRDRFLFHYIRYIILFPIPVNLSNCRKEAFLLFNSTNIDFFISVGNC